jgi:MFS family permease
VTGEDEEVPVTHLDEEQQNQWWLVVAAGLAVFMASVDLSIVTVALPVIERDLGLSTSAAEWVVLAYLLPLAGLALPSARWLDTVGRRPALSFSLTGFALASLAAGLAPDLGWLIGARLAQGSFGALLFALVPALATTAVRPEARGRAMGLITTLGPLGLISGPVLGGLLVDGPGWPWIFFVNLPVSLAVLLVGLRLLPTDLPLRVPDLTWFAEAGLLSVAVAALLLALTLTAEHGPVWLLLAAVAVPVLGGWLGLPVSRPVRRLLRTPGVGAPHLALAGAATAIGVVFFIAPFFLQRALGESAATAGVTLLAFPAGMALTGPIGGFLGDGWGWRRTALLGAALFTIGLLLLAPMDASWELGDVAWRLFLAGCGNGLFNAPNMAIAMSQAPPPLLATTGATTSLARQLGFAFGPALATVTWGLSSYRPESMTAPVLLATACSAVSVASLLRLGPTTLPSSHTSPSEPPRRNSHA